MKLPRTRPRLVFNHRLLQILSTLPAGPRHPALPLRRGPRPISANPHQPRCPRISACIWPMVVQRVGHLRFGQKVRL